MGLITGTIYRTASGELAQNVNATCTVIQETEKAKHLPSNIVKLMKQQSHAQFTMHNHTKLWKAQDAKGADKGYGVQIEKNWDL